MAECIIMQPMTSQPRTNFSRILVKIQQGAVLSNGDTATDLE